MRRNRGLLLNFVGFLLILVLLIFFNIPSHPTSKHFAWTKVQYQSRSPVPPSHGVCPGLSNRLTKPVLVIARIKSEPLSALDDNLSSIYHICPYTADAVQDPKSTYLQTPSNRGHEAMAYLTFIVDNYENLPSTGMVFVHGSRFAWHNDDPDYDNVSLLKQLNVSRALWGPPGPSTGYWNMRCDWSAGMCNADERPQGSIETRIRATTERDNLRAVSDVALVAALEAIFGSSTTESQGPDNQERILQTALSRKDIVKSQCCAQFVVARENIWRHSRDEYVALRQWLLDGSARHGDNTHPQILNNGNEGRMNRLSPSDDRIAGRVLSYIWHILFLPSPAETHHQVDPEVYSQSGINAAGTVDLVHLNNLACPRADECYCRLYGRCRLPGCQTPGHCRGQYRVPMGYRLPDGWAETHA